jgi:Ca-activated chloride channel family protein
MSLVLAKTAGVCILAMLSFQVEGAVAAQSNGSPSTRQALSVDVDLVNVTAAVTDDSGKFIDSLTVDDFQLFADGQQQEITFFSHDSLVPISIGVLIDVSGSLQDKLRQGLETVREIATTLSSNDEMFVITFNSHVDVRQRFTSDPEAIQKALGEIRTRGETAIFDAISAGLREMQSAKHQKKVLLLVSDGFDTKSNLKAGEIVDLLKRSDVRLYALGIDDNDETPPRKRPKYHTYDYMLNTLTSAGGGRFIRLYTGWEYDLRKLARSFLEELHQEYAMGYYPLGRYSLGRRNIEVRVTKPGVHVVCTNCR